MKIIIAGTRDLHVTINDIDEEVRNSGFEVTEVLSGRSGKVDLTGELWARVRGIPVRPFPADWNKYGKAAGPIRNMGMAQVGDGLILVWDGKSHGSRDMRNCAKSRGLSIHEVIKEN